MRAEAASAGATADLIEAGINNVVFNGRSATLKLTTRASQFAVHVVEMDASGALVKIVNVLRAEKVVASKSRFKIGKGEVRGIGIDFPGPCKCATRE